jgi:acyl carrier protein
MGQHEEISAAEIAAVYPRVAQTIADALGKEPADVRPDASLIEDLGAESIDFLDIVFRLERGFKIKIPRGKIVEDARGELSVAEFVEDGVLTEAGARRLREYLSEVPAERFPARLRIELVPALFTPHTFCKVVVRALKASEPVRQ